MSRNEPNDPANNDDSGKSGTRIAPALRRHLNAHPDETVEILVTLDTPQPDLSGVIGGGALRGPVDARPGNPSEIDEIADRVRVKLSKSGIPVMNWLPNAQSLVVRISADQLQQVSEIEGVLEILPNEALK